MIEFDVLPARGGRGELYVAHDYGALDPARLARRWRRRSSTSRTRAVRGDPPPARHQAPRHRARGARGARRQRDARARVHQHRACAACCRASARWRRSIRARLDGARHPVVVDSPVAADARAPLPDRLLPARAAARIRAGAIDALVPHWRARHAPRSSRRSRGAGGEIYAVDGRRRRARSRGSAALGVTGVITNDPRLFARDRADRGAVAGRVGAGAGAVAGASSSAASVATTRAAQAPLEGDDAAQQVGVRRARRDREVLARLARARRGVADRARSRTGRGADVRPAPWRRGTRRGTA